MSNFPVLVAAGLRLRAVAVLVLGVGVASATAWTPPRAGADAAAAGPGTIYDPTLQVTWLADANLAATHKFGLTSSSGKVPPINQDGSMQYATAVEWVKRLNHYNHGKGWLGHHNWTLPITQTPYVDSGCKSDNPKGGGSFGLGCKKAPLAELYTHLLGLHWPETAVPIFDTESGPFHDFQPYLYWSGTQVRKNGKPFGFYTFSFNTGWAGENQDQHWMYVLPMIAGKPFGGAAKPALQPVDGGRAVYEPGAPPGGVTWLADADLARTQPLEYRAHINGRDGSMEHTTAANWVAALNTHHWLGRKHGWTLPTPQQLNTLYTDLEAKRLVSPQQPIVPVPNNIIAGFQHLQPYLYWSCAGTSISGRCHGTPNPNNQQWSFSFGNGFLGTDVKQNSLYVEVYYPTTRPGHRCHRHPGQPPCR